MTNYRAISVACIIALLTVATASCAKPVQRKSSGSRGQDAPWIDSLLADQQSGSNTVIEAVEYLGQAAFHVLPEDRDADSGNEHILYDQYGNLICEYGGIVGRVTKGACDFEKIVFRKRLFPR